MLLLNNNIQKPGASGDVSPEALPTPVAQHTTKIFLARRTKGKKRFDYIVEKADLQDDFFKDVVANAVSFPELKSIPLLASKCLMNIFHPKLNKIIV